MMIVNKTILWRRHNNNHNIYNNNDDDDDDFNDAIQVGIGDDIKYGSRMM